VSTFSQIAAGLAAQFKGVEGLRVQDHMPAKVNPPELCIYLEDAEPIAMGNGSFEANYRAYLFISSTVARIGQQNLHDTISPDAVWSAFGFNNDLDLDDGTRATLQRYRGLSIEEFAAYPYYGGVLEIRVTTPGA
jgi:hypothetical protein